MGEDFDNILDKTIWDLASICLMLYKGGVCNLCRLQSYRWNGRNETQLLTGRDELAKNYTLSYQTFQLLKSSS